MTIENKFANLNLLVVGDVMLDEYVYGDVNRISPEAPVPVVEGVDMEYRAGGAANAAVMAAALGANVTVLGVIGQDDAGARLKKCLADAGVVASLVPMPSRVTERKLRCVGRAAHRHPQQLLRIDYGNNEPLSDRRQAEVAGWLPPLRGVDAVLVSDYGKAVCHKTLLRHLIAMAGNAGIPIIIDPSRQALASRYVDYTGATAITPNRYDAAKWHGLGDTINVHGAGVVAMQMRTECKLSAAVVTMDRDGAVVCDSAAAPTNLTCRPRQVYDVTGAGDVFAAVLALGLGCHMSAVEAANLANIAGGLEVERFGCQPISWLELMHAATPTDAKVVDRRVARALAKETKARGQKVVFTNGCFDMLHPGHIACLTEAKKQGDLLIVGINTDASVTQLKGRNRPLCLLDTRAACLAALAVVDVVVPFSEATPIELIQMVAPDVLVKGGDTPPDKIPGADFVIAAGGRVHLTTYLPPYSTTKIADAMG